jgi:hypothetical protein
VEVRDHLDEVIEAAIVAMQEEIPVYAEPALLADVPSGRAPLPDEARGLLGGQNVTLEDLSFTRGDAAGARGLRPGDASTRSASGSRRSAGGWTPRQFQLGHEAALSLATPLMRYCDFASTLAGHAYASSSSARSPTPTASGDLARPCWPASPARGPPPPPRATG